MPWFKVDDRLPFHAKVLKAGNEAMGLWVRAGAWSTGHGTDGFIPQETAKILGRRASWSRLVDARLFVETDGGFRMHDFLDYNPSAEVVADSRVEKSEKKREAGRLGGKKSGEVRRSKSASKHEAKPKHDASLSASETKQKNEAKRSPDPDPDPQKTSGSDQNCEVDPTSKVDPPQSPPGAGEAKPDSGPRRYSASEPMVDTSSTAVFEAVERFKAKMLARRGRWAFATPPLTARRLMVEILNGHCRGNASTQTALGAIAEMERFVGAWVEAHTGERAKYAGTWQLDTFAKWLNAPRTHDDDDGEVPADLPEYEGPAEPYVAPKPMTPEQREQAAHFEKLRLGSKKIIKSDEVP
jgi:hypothetical protein